MTSKAVAPTPTETAQPGRWTITVPGWRPTLDNELVYKHWSVSRRRKRKDADVIAIGAQVYRVPPATGRRRLKLTIRGPFRTFPDDSAPLKSLWDALVKNRLLVDDSREWLEFVWPPTYERAKAKETVIELEDI